MTQPAAFQQLVTAFDALPGIGPKAAARLAEFAVLNPAGAGLAVALNDARTRVVLCQRCFALTDSAATQCAHCQRQTDRQTLYVVSDLAAHELAQGQGKAAFVLHGLLSPVAGIGPKQLRLAELRGLVQQEKPQQVVLLFPAGAEADATEVFIRTLLDGTAAGVSRDALNGGADHG